MIKDVNPIPHEQPYEEIPSFPRPSGMLKLNRNVAFLMLLLVCIASIHNQQLPNGQTVMAAVQGAVDEEWDESLGRITYVDHLLPETLAVFLQPEAEYTLSLPCNVPMTHAWESHAPYLSFDGQNQAVFSVADGEIMSRTPDASGQISLRIRHENGLESVYYHLSAVSLQEGDPVKAGQEIGKASASSLVLDVRRNGLSIDPTSFFHQNTP